MAWTEYSRTEQIVKFPGLAITFTAGSDIKKGQGVYISDDWKVAVPTDATKVGVGVAAYDADAGDEVTVYMTGSIVKIRVNTTNAVSEVGVDADGVFTDATDTTPVAKLLTTIGSTGARTAWAVIL